MVSHQFVVTKAIMFPHTGVIFFRAQGDQREGHLKDFARHLDRLYTGSHHS